MQKINFNEKLEANETIFFILEIVKKPFWIFQGNHKSSVNLFCFDIISMKNDSK